MEIDDDLWTDPIGPSPDSLSPPPPPDSSPPPRPPEPEGDPPPSPESYSTPVSLLDWATDKLLCLRTALFVLLGTFGLLQGETLDRFTELERSAGDKGHTDSWIDSLWPSTASGPNVASPSMGDSSTAVDRNMPSTSKKSFWMGESSMDFGSNVASESQASSWMGESSTAFDPNVPSTSKKSFWMGESSMDFGSNVASESQAPSWMGESSTAFDSNVPSTFRGSSCKGESSMGFDTNVASSSLASSWMGESSMDFDPNVPSTSQASSSCKGESSMDFESDVASTSQASSRKRKYPTSTPKPTREHDEAAAIRFGRDFALRGGPLLKSIEDFCAKYMRHKEVCKEMKDALIDIETIFVIKRNRKVKRNVDDRIDVGKFMALWGGVKALRNLAEKIVRDQKLLCNKLHYIMRRKSRLDQLFREDHSLSSMAQKDNCISYSMYWIYQNLVFVDKIMERKRKMHVMFKAVTTKLQDDLDKY